MSFADLISLCTHSRVLVQDLAENRVVERRNFTVHGRKTTNTQMAYFFSKSRTSPMRSFVPSPPQGAFIDAVSA